MGVLGSYKSLFGRFLGIDNSTDGGGLVAQGYGYHPVEGIKTLSTSDSFGGSHLYIIDDSSATVDYELTQPKGTGRVVEVMTVSTSTAATVSLSSALGNIVSTAGSSTYTILVDYPGGYVRLVDLTTSAWYVTNLSNAVPSS